MAKPKPLTEEEECLLATMPRGSVLLYPSATVHGASANQTEEMRDVCFLLIHLFLGDMIFMTNDSMNKASLIQEDHGK